MLCLLSEVWTLTQNEDLCQNYTFWKNQRCNNFMTRCTGNYPGQCVKKYGNKTMLNNMTLVKIWQIQIFLFVFMSFIALLKLEKLMLIATMKTLWSLKEIIYS
jgi:hypothetical protein